MTHYLITGANRGLGLEFVRQLLARGDAVTACCRDPKKAEDLKGLGTGDAAERLKIYALDVADSADIAALPEKLQDDGVQVDVLINNAGMASFGNEEVGNFQAELIERVLRTNSVAPMLLTQALLPMLEASQQSPKVVCITSSLGSITQADGLAYGLSYGMSKAALNMGVKLLSGELKGRGIAILTLHPGWVQTDMGGANATLKPAQSIQGMLRVIDDLSVKTPELYLDYAGKELPW